MKRLKRTTITRLIAACFMIFALGLTGFARINNNEAGGAYNSPGGLYNKNNLIETYIVDGAGFYLNAAADIQALLKLVELQDSQGLDFSQLARLADSAATHMKNARETYGKLIETAEATPYNDDVRAALKKFDYNAFRQTNGLNQTVFENIEIFLGNGDVTGAFKKTYSYFTDILGLLNIVREEASLTKLPGLEIFWRLNETCAETSLFGSYVTRVFLALR